MLMEATTISREEVAARLLAAQQLAEADRPRGLVALNELFRAGSVPAPQLNGRYTGELVAITLSPILIQVARSQAGDTLPWLGKSFDPVISRGNNIFTLASRKRVQRWLPGYRGTVEDGPSTFHAFAFKTNTGPGKVDRDRQVLKIDYNLPENPALTIRRVLDELVEVADGLYLGKAFVHWWWGSWSLVAYFSLRVPELELPIAGLWR